MRKLLLAAILTLVNTFAVFRYSYAIDIDINTTFMNSTFKLTCNSKREPGKRSCGTIFILAVQPKNNLKTISKLVLVTADHVLSDCSGDKAKLYLRKINGNHFVKFEFPINIREGGKNKWVKHPEVDVAVMEIKKFPLDAHIMLAGTNILSTDNVYYDFDIYPGRDVSVIGFPLCLDANDVGFPILRKGKISSYPLVPSKINKSFLVDVNVLGRNSGGPVYFYDPDWHKIGSGNISAPVRVQIILGLLSKGTKIELADVVHASFIKETIDMLPP
jgi:hypothetical protein